MEQNETQNGISIAELWGVFIGHVWQIVLAGLLVLVILVGYSLITYSAEYTSTATVYILRQEEENAGGSSSPSISDFSLALSTVNDCTRLLKSRNVLDKVIDELGMDISYQRLSNMITIVNPTNTRYLEISVTAPTPSDAKIIVDKLCEVGRNSMVAIMGINQVNQVDEGTFNEVPSNSMVGLLCYVGALVAALVVYAVYLVIYLFDDKIGSPEDVEKHLGLSVLGVIPNAQDAAGARYGRYGKSKYGYGQKNAHNEAEGSNQ